jgi:hypothetical protein
VIDPVVKIAVEGHVDDLYALSLLFPKGACPDLHVVTAITGAKDGLLDRVQNADRRETFVTGNRCLSLIAARQPQEAGWIAREIIAPLNGYAVLADSNFTPVVPVSASWEGEGFSGGAIFRSAVPHQTARLVTTNRHGLLKELLPNRVAFMTENPLAAYAALVLGGRPSWAEYYRLLEDIAGHRGTTLDKLPEAGLAKRQALNGFKTAANNRAFGRHGTSKRNTSLSQEALMNLLEAREFIRTVVSTWLDIECGGRMPRDRVDGGPLRFGLDDTSR